MHLGVYIFDTHLFVVLKGSHKETHFLEVFDLQASCNKSIHKRVAPIGSDKK